MGWLQTSCGLCTCLTGNYVIPPCRSHTTPLASTAARMYVFGKTEEVLGSILAKPEFADKYVVLYTTHHPQSLPKPCCACGLHNTVLLLLLLLLLLLWLLVVGCWLLGFLL